MVRKAELIVLIKHIITNIKKLSISSDILNNEYEISDKAYEIVSLSNDLKRYTDELQTILNQ